MKTAISIGTFDAVHLGHAALIQSARSAVGNDGKVVVWSFNPPPITVLKPEKPFDRITTIEERIRLLQDIGADEVKCITPTKEFLNKTPEEFVQDVIDEVNPSIFVEGKSFRFGKDRGGTTALLKEIGKQKGFECLAVDSVEITIRDHSIVTASSSMVRWLINEGRVEDAALMLGRPVGITGVVQQGNQRGRTIGIRTANVHQVETMIPKEGIYAGVAEVEGTTYPTAISIGTKPTFGQNDLTCEAHLLGFESKEDYYDWQLRLNITHWIRNQIKFDSIEELKNAIQGDLKMVSSLVESNT